MTASRTRVERWENKLQQVFDEIDAELEAEGRNLKYTRHPARPPAGATGNPEDDGLFDLGAAFSVGIGSRHGRGYVVQARIATLDHVSAAAQKKLEDDVARRLRKKLPAAFPGVKLHVNRDGHVYKIHGDLSLGQV
ncbi:MAG: hypothetical protein PHI93_01010 [Kiritimatiellae bacterium]|jgi:hypothetical protein|nr:hypothetical protein [Kiritimatiellia bacterium]MDY0149237.1 hypothetical protein [Kiritimatiellia bacterium]